MKTPNSTQIGAGASLIIGGTLLPALAASLVLRNLGGILGLFLERGGELDFASIFSQLQNAQIRPHWLIPLLLFAAFAALLYFVPPRGKLYGLWVAAYVAAGLMLLFACFVLSLLLSHVNDVRFIDLLRALIPMLKSL